MKRINLKQTARKILENNQYMTLSSVGLNTLPWASPVVYFYDKKSNLYFISLPGSRHCRNIERNKNLAVAIFDSHQDLGAGVGLQMEAKAEMMPRNKLAWLVKLSLSRNWPYGKPATLKQTRRFFRLYKYRFYKITPTKIWMNDPRKETDERVLIRSF